MFIVMILLAVGAATWYLSISLHKALQTLFPKIKYAIILSVLSALAVSMVFGFASSRLPLPAWIQTLFAFIFAYGLSFYVYLLFFCVLSDCVIIVFNLFKRPVLRNKTYRAVSLSCVAVLTLGVGIYGLCNAKEIDKPAYQVRIESEADLSDLRLVMISDVHLGAVGAEARLAEIVDEINALQPDIVCIAGDFFDSTYEAVSDPEAALQTMRRLSATYGVYACLGNHDAGDSVDKMQAFLAAANVKLLNDEYVIIDERLVLVGRLDDAPHGGNGGRKRKALSEILTAETEGLPVIALDHNPKHIDGYETEADLVLSGHTHNGQIFPMTILTDFIYTVDYGYYQNENGTQIIVSSGVGYWGMPIRVGTDSEIVSVTFA